jgi:hypothetical protein
MIYKNEVRVNYLESLQDSLQNFFDHCPLLIHYCISWNQIIFRIIPSNIEESIYFQGNPDPNSGYLDKYEVIKQIKEKLSPHFPKVVLNYTSIEPLTTSEIAQLLEDGKSLDEIESHSTKKVVSLKGYTLTKINTKQNLIILQDSDGVDFRWKAIIPIIMFQEKLFSKQYPTPELLGEEIKTLFKLEGRNV